MKLINKIVTVVFLFNVAISSYAQIILPEILSNGVILQRETNIKIWGWASPGEAISVNFTDSAYSAVAGKNGEWSIVTKKYSAGGPYTMVFKGKNEITVSNILIGDVWFCSGQSNMETNMKRVEPLYIKEISECKNTNIRQFYMPRKYNFKEEQDNIEWGEWKEAKPENIYNFSAVAYFFAYYLNKNENVPVGIINTALGGSPAQAWMSEEALKEFPGYFNELQKFKNDSVVKSIDENNKMKLKVWNDELGKKDPAYNDISVSWDKTGIDISGWEKTTVPSYWKDNDLEGFNGSVWFKKRFTLNNINTDKPARLLVGTIIDVDSVFVNGIFTGSTGYQYPPRRYTVPAGVLKNGENEITVRIISQMGTGGFVPDKPYELLIDGQTIDLTGEWYYKPGARMEPLEPEDFIRFKSGGLYNAMLAPFFNYNIKGILWYQGESNDKNPVEYRDLFPALINDWRKGFDQGDVPFIYAQLPNYMETSDTPSVSDWAIIREAQLDAQKLKNTAMAVTIDIGEWNDIHPLNKKDAGYRLYLAAEKVAYKKDIVYTGPTYNSMTKTGNKIIITFTNTGGGLTIKEGNELKQFAIAGPDKTFKWAKAKIEGNTVIVWNDTVNDPVAVRYAWANNPEGANLYNMEGLPASPFRTDNWDK